jgi:hypothetical protein
LGEWYLWPYELYKFCRDLLSAKDKVKEIREKEAERDKMLDKILDGQDVTEDEWNGADVEKAKQEGIEAAKKVGESGSELVGSGAASVPE